MNENICSDIIQNSPVGYCIITSDLDLLFINDALLKYLENTENTVKGKNWINSILEKNYIKSRAPIITRWLRIKFNSQKPENKFVMKIYDDLRIDFYVHIKTLKESGNLQTTDKINRLNLVTIYPISGTILLHQSSLSRKLSKEYKIAGKIQRNINDYIIDMIEGRYFKYHFKRLFLPSGILSGDIVNIKPVSRRYSSVFLGDGRGHGLPAALYSALIHSYLNIMASDVNHGATSSAELMSQVNKYAYRDFYETGEFYFFSGVYGLIDGNSRSFCLTNAGHPYPIFIRDGEIQRLNSNGPLVGIDRESTYTESMIELKGGDTMILFTDGLYDVIHGDPQDHHDGITNILKDQMAEHDIPASGLFQYLVDTITAFKSRLDINDDITILQMTVEEKK